MFDQLTDLISTQLPNFVYLNILLSCIIHLFFAGAVARDSGNFQRLGVNTVLVSGYIWAFATLAGGVYVATIYWILHHSSFFKSTTKELNHD